MTVRRARTRTHSRALAAACLVAIPLLLGACGGSGEEVGGPDPESPTVSDQPPSITLTRPAEFSTVVGMVELTANASDDGTSLEVRFSVDGEVIAVDSDGSDGWYALWNSTTVTNARHDIRAEATDDAGHTRSSEVFVIVDNSSLNDEWTQRAFLGGLERDRATAFTIEDRAYVGLGQADGNAASVSDIWEYDPATDTWRQVADFPGEPRMGAAAFSVGGRGYVGTGNRGQTHLRDFWEYDPATNSWSQIADFGGGGRRGAVGFSIGDKGYVGTGSEAPSGGQVSDFWEYDPSDDTWTRKADVPGPPRYYGVAFAMGETGYLGLGWSLTEEEVAFQDFYAYDPATDAWTRRADLPGPGRLWAAGFSAGGKGYVGTGHTGEAGGSGGTNLLSDVWEYDPATDSWTQRKDWPATSRLAPVAFTVGDRGFVGTGSHSGREQRDLWELTLP